MLYASSAYINRQLSFWKTNATTRGKLITMIKTNKSLTKRLRITKKGKIIARKPGKNHFNAKENRQSQLGGKRTVTVVMSNKDKSRFLPSLVKNK